MGERQMSESAMVEAAQLSIYPNAAAAMTEAGTGWFGKGLAVMAARHAVTAWAAGGNGDDSGLAAMADIPERVTWLLFPDGDHAWRDQWVVAPDPLVTELTIWRLEPAADPPELNVQWRFAGRQHWLGTGPDAAAPHDGGEETFVGMLTLKITGSGSGDWPWQLTLANVRTLDQYLGYTFETGVETEDECRRRTGADGPLAPTDDYLLVADFAEHDVKFGSTATAEVSSDPAPTRDEAVRLVEPAMQEECVRGRGGEVGDWRPSLSHLRVIRLLGPA
jgi:hypothetical protein